jgi:hypothetical protein
MLGLRPQPDGFEGVRGSLSQPSAMVSSQNSVLASPRSGETIPTSVADPPPCGPSPPDRRRWQRFAGESQARMCPLQSLPALTVFGSCLIACDLPATGIGLA